MTDATDHHPDDVSRASRYGLILFFVYLALYAGFMGISAFKPQLMAIRPFGGVNLAIWYGMVLIVAPLLLSAVYLVLCRRRDRA
ncbi:MAG: DUF485 domain-containing protein [Planctomycetes bacterium]|nr:DUF485 domain-containing protein [Planctomycetota bacterium]